MKLLHTARVFLMEFAMKYAVCLLVMLCFYTAFSQQMDLSTAVTIAAGLLLYDVVKLVVAKGKVGKNEA